MPTEYQQLLFEDEHQFPPIGAYPYLDLLKDRLSPASFEKTMPDPEGYITIIDDMGYDFELNVHGDQIIKLLDCIDIDPRF